MADWADLNAELEAWRLDGRKVTFWWRDDDSQYDDPTIHRLLTLRRELQVPLAVSAIPSATDSLFAENVNADSDVYVLQHGYAHGNHAPPGVKKSELAENRAGQTVFKELRLGMGTLRTLFDDRCLPVLVPPWNRIHEKWVVELPGLGYRGLSMMTPRTTAFTEQGLHIVNVHVDIVDWRGSRGFIGLDRALDQLVTHLQQRRNKDVDADEPTGLLTHHLMHDEGCWGFIDELIHITNSHPSVQWLPASKIFNLG